MFNITIFILDNNSSKQTNLLNLTKNSNRLYEKMIIFPTCINSSRNDKTQSILFAIKSTKLTSSSIPQQTANLAIKTNLNATTPSLPSPSFLTQTSYDCNMDSFKTNMTRKGLILYTETNNLRNLLAKSQSIAKTSASSNGLLCDIKNGKHVNILDYVHSNDQNHINQHINNGNYFLDDKKIYF